MFYIFSYTIIVKKYTPWEGKMEFSTIMAPITISVCFCVSLLVYYRTVRCIQRGGDSCYSTRISVCLPAQWLTPGPVWGGWV